MLAVCGHTQRYTITDAGQLLTNRLKPGTRTFRVYFKLGENAPASRFQTWIRTVKDTVYRGQPAVLVSQQIIINDTIVDTGKAIFNRQSLVSLYHETWNRQRGTEVFDFAGGSLQINQLRVTATDTAARNKQALEGFEKARARFFLNWHTDLELFPLLPFADSTVIIVPFYHPGSSGPVDADYKVKGSAVYEDERGTKTDCWLVHYENRSVMVFWIDKKTGEVLKLEEQFGEHRFRYKVQI